MLEPDSLWLCKLTMKKGNAASVHLAWDAGQVMTCLLKLNNTL